MCRNVKVLCLSIGASGAIREMTLVRVLASMTLEFNSTCATFVLGFHTCCACFTEALKAAKYSLESGHVTRPGPVTRLGCVGCLCFQLIECICFVFRTLLAIQLAVSCFYRVRQLCFAVWKHPVATEKDLEGT